MTFLLPKQHETINLPQIHCPELFTFILLAEQKYSKI